MPLSYSSTSSKPSSPQAFKGIALFTPGGDLVYCLDTEKRSRWHLDLCAALQEHFALPDPPYFLLPAYTATLDCWVDPVSQQPITLAEAYPRVLRFQSLLNAVFALDAVRWQPVYSSPAICSPSLIETYRPQFPQLWENHDLILRVKKAIASTGSPYSLSVPSLASGDTQTFIFRLFVNGAETAVTEELLRLLHEMFETTLKRPYTLKVIDVTQHPEQAEADQISVTPTLVRASPGSLRKLSGDLKTPQRVLNFLQAR
ncbi:MAG TPA: circadian clock KaiB family protein [Leptolyngbyaceae cyanobacterium]